MREFKSLKARIRQEIRRKRLFMKMFERLNLETIISHRSSILKFLNRLNETAYYLKNTLISVHHLDKSPL